MARAGQVVENPVTGARVVLRTTSKESDGSTWEADLFYPPHTGKVATRHFHPNLDEQFTILAGVACYVLGRAEQVAQAGEQFVIPAGAPHLNPWNCGDETLHIRQTLHLRKPDLATLVAFEDVLETLFGLARDGKVDQDGVPRNPLQAIVLLKGYQPGGYVAGLPIPVQRLLFGALAAVAGLFGYKTRYPQYSLEGQEDDTVHLAPGR